MDGWHFGDLFFDDTCYMLWWRVDDALFDFEFGEYVRFPKEQVDAAYFWDFE